jgi:hypothetical protein
MEKSMTSQVTGIDTFGIHSSGTGDFDLRIANSENLTANRTLTVKLNDADRTLDLGGNLTISGAATVSGTNTGDQTITLTGDVTGSGTGSFATSIASDAVTFGKMQNIPTDSLIGRDTASSGDPESILLNATLEMDGSGNLRRAALTGDVTASADSNATTIANDAVTYAKMQNVSAASKLLGRGDSGTGDPQEISLGTGLSMSGTTLNVSAAGSVYSGIIGLKLSNNTTDAINDIDVSAGRAWDPTYANELVLASAVTKRSDAAWAVGSGNGGWDTGSVADGVIAVWLIKRSDTGVTDLLLSASFSAPTMPTNYDYKRLIGAVVRVSNTIKAFTQYGDIFRFTTAITDVSQSGNPGSSSWQTATLSVPPASIAWVKQGSSASSFGANSVPVTTNGWSSGVRIASSADEPLASFSGTSGAGGTASHSMDGELEHFCPVNSSRQLEVFRRGVASGEDSNSGTHKVYTLGFILTQRSNP